MVLPLGWTTISAVELLPLKSLGSVEAVARVLKSFVSGDQRNAVTVELDSLTTKDACLMGGKQDVWGQRLVQFQGKEL